MSDNTTRIADALVKIATNQFVSYRQALITILALGVGMFAAYSAQPGSVSQAEFDRTLLTIAADIGEIRKDVRELRKEGG